MPCPPCGRGFHAECYTQCKKCHPKKKSLEKVKASSTTSTEYKKRGKTAKDLTDAHSTGRKRAAELYPVDKTAPCEWQGQRNCGGGEYPIVGCLDGKQQHRHHGPVKDTTRNQQGNVHRICTPCHNHWHELNDVNYEPRRYGLLPHDPEPATTEEIIRNALEWSSGVIAKNYVLASSVNKKKKKKIPTVGEFLEEAGIKGEEPPDEKINVIEI